MEKHKNNNKNKKPHAILIPLPLQGHVIPFVQLAIKLASKGFSITFINAQHIHHQISLSNPTASLGPTDIFSGLRSTSEVDDIEYVTVSDGLPLEYDRSLNHDRWIEANMYSLPEHVEVAVAEITSSRPSVCCCLVADSYFVWPSKVAKKFGLCYVTFWTEPALVLDVYFHVHLLTQNGHLGPGRRKDTIDYIPGVKSIKPTDLTSYLQEEDLATFYHQFLFGAIDDTKRADFVLCNTVQELEAPTISAIKAQIPFYAIGPIFRPGFTKGPVITSLWAESNCTHWLDSKPLGSVLYVSFGSYAHLSKDELVEIANGIKLSGVNFIWVIRPDMVSSDDPDPLPAGFQDEVTDRGLIVTWTNQIAVLSHGAVGGFLTHCGWNSILESIWYEIPMLCFPLLTDQLTNRKLVVDDWRIGCTLCEERPVRKEEVSQKVGKLFSEEMRHELKKRIKENKGMLKDAMTTQGSSEKNIDSFIKDLNAAVEGVNNRYLNS